MRRLFAYLPRTQVQVAQSDRNFLDNLRINFELITTTPLVSYGVVSFDFISHLDCSIFRLV